MKKVASICLTLILILTTILPTQVKASEVALTPLPEVGETVAGFKTLERGIMDIVNGETVLFEHEKSGAQLMYIQNTDKDRSFDISFKTPALDNTGVNHILEHISVSGSKKYPFKDILFTIINQTYSTFVNAFTTPTITSYPVSSMSEAQLMKLMDVYMDCVFNPSIYDDPMIFKREGWRYEKVDEETPLSMTGIVYSEMQGALSNISSAAMYNTLDALYPESIIRNVSGGDPAYIPDLTYEKVLEVHDTYYHPSNALIVLYGDLDYEKFLEFLDKEYLSQYEKKGIAIERGIIEPLTEQVSKDYDYPVSQTANTKNAAQINYAYALTDISDVDSIGMEVIAGLLSHEASQMQQAFKEEGFGANLVVGYDISLPQPLFQFVVMNADETKKEAFKTFIDTTMNEMIEKGFNQQILDAIIASTEFSNANTTEIPNLGVNLSMVIAQMWASSGDLNYLSRYNENIAYIKTQMDTGYLEGLAEKYIVGNQHAAIVATVPKAGLLEENTQKLADQIKVKEESMTLEEVSQIIEETQQFNEWNAKEEDQEGVRDIQAITIGELPVELKEYITYDETKDGVRYLMAEANVSGTTDTGILFDTSAVSVEKLHYLKLFADLTGKLSTSQYTKEEMDILSTRYLNGLDSLITLWTKQDEAGYNPVYMTGFTSLVDDYERSIEVVAEILLHTDFSNTDEMLNIVQRMRSDYKMYFTQNPLSPLMYYNIASHNDAINYQTYMGELAYYEFLGVIEQQLIDSKQEVTKELDAVREKVMNKQNLIIEFAGHKDSLPVFEETIQSLVEQLPQNEIIKQDYSTIPTPSKQIGLVVDTTVNYNILGASLEELGITFDGKYVPLMKVIDENYLTPQIRFQNNAYGAGLQLSDMGIMMFSHRDPYIDKTLEVYKGIPQFIREYELTQETLDRYIMKSFGEYTTQRGELSGAINALFSDLQGSTMEKRLEVLEQIKAAKVSDFKALAEVFEQVSEVGAWGSAASLETLNTYPDLYDQKLTIEEAKEGEAPQVLTKGELITLLLGPDLFEVAVQQGLIAGERDEATTREEVVLVIDTILAMQGASALLVADPTIMIADAEAVSEVAQDAINRFVGSGIVALDEEGCVNPKEGVTQKEVIAMIEAVDMYLRSLQQPAA